MSDRSYEPLSPGGAATQLHYDPEDAVIWLDTDIGTEDGLIVGVGGDRGEAIRDAIVELRERITDLERALQTEAA